MTAPLFGRGRLFARTVTQVDIRPGVEGDPLTSPGERLKYLGLPPPPSGHHVRVAPGVHWVRLPLPMELDHINVWLLEHEGGFVLVDTGIASSLTREAWERLEREVFAAHPLRLILLTHLHPDHVGLAAWLQARHSVPVWASRQTDALVANLLRPLTEAELAERTGFFVRHGLENATEIEQFLRGGRYRSAVSGVPRVEHWPADGDEVAWGGTTWRFIDTPGHASGHLCLHAAAPSVLIAGDQVLPTISPNVSLTGWNADDDPLASYLDSLERLSALAPETLVLPSHGRPFRGLRERAADLRAHHRGQLARLIEACATPMNAHQCAGILFRRSLRGLHQFLALGEAIAHLEYLAGAGQLKRSTDAQGFIRYARADG
jgi:glyoxylase-like metal-dependent hydrolase (beta-lactamase superfamily II)